MAERFQSYFETLESLSTEELDRSVEKLVRAEKKNTALVIAHIAEMSRRKGALERGYRNLFEYCSRRLNLSEGSVAMRIQVANVCRRFPELLVALAENQVSLTVAALLAPHLTESNIEKLLAECTGMTKREAEEHLVALRPRPVFEPSIRKTPSQERKDQASLPSAPGNVSSSQMATPVPETFLPVPAPRKSSNLLQPARPELFNFRFAAGREFKEKFERLAEVLGVENPLQHMAEILEQAVDIALDKKDPKRKRERRLTRQGRQSETLAPQSRPDEISSGQKPGPSRYIPAEVRERVYARAGYECEWRGPDGRRCRSRTGLEIEHERPFALYRSHDERFLRLLCRAHNALSAQRVYGAAFIKDKIESSRRLRAEQRAERDGGLLEQVALRQTRQEHLLGSHSEARYSPRHETGRPLLRFWFQGSLKTLIHTPAH